ncbi:MAG: efflux RND transporter periplasmic adaptor subunit [Akkermansia sp.]|nr:efflux RND transporter periplasmic adaptor subunit [Akkermansia sp.]
MRYTLCLLALTPLTVMSAMAQRPAASEHVQVEKVTIGKDRITRKSIGHMEAIRSVAVKSAVEGFLGDAKFREGSIVKAGDVLFEISPVRYKAAVAQAEAAVAEIEARIVYAEKSYKRLARLAEAQATSVETTESAHARLEELKASLAGAKAELVRANKDLEDCTIRAEITGRIGRVEFSEGNYVTKGETLATIKQMDPIYVRFPLSQSDVNGIFRGPREIGNVADVRLNPANGRRYEHAGKVAIVDNLLTSGTDTYTLWAEFPNKDNMLTPRGIGAMFISLTDTQQVCMVPLTAIHYDADGAFVYTVSDGDNQVARQPVIVGSIQGRLQSVYTGLSEGQTIITDGAHKVRVGDKVIPVSAQPDTLVDESGNVLEQEQPLEVETTPVVMAKDPTVLVCQGARLEAVNRVNLRPLVQGVLAAPSFTEGDLVEKDSELFSIDPTRYQAVVDARKSAVAQLEVKIKDATRKYDRQVALLSSNATSQDDMESAKAALDELLAQKKKADAALVIAQDDLSRCTMYAPITGRIGRVNFSEGTYISDMKSPLATLVQISPIYVRFSLSENAILSNYGTDDRLKDNAEVTLVTANGNTYHEKGSVYFSDNVIQTTTDTQNFWAVFKNEDGQLRPGGVVTIRVSRKADRKVPAVASHAILTDTSGHYVYALRHNRAVQVRVLTGTPDENGLTPIFAGLREGDRCIVSPMAEIEDGRLVTPAPEQTTTSEEVETK